MTVLASIAEIVSFVSLAVALASISIALVLGAKLRRLRRAQTVVLGSESRDLVEHAAQLDQALSDFRTAYERHTDSVQRTLDTHQQRIDDALAYRAVIRYDAYEELGGRQSSSIALLDSQRSGVVISSINQREHGRVYVKQIHRGESEFELLPEEKQAIDAATGAGPSSAP
jgi:hypothetical protein